MWGFLCSCLDMIFAITELSAPVGCSGIQQDRNGFEVSYLAISETRLSQLLFMMFPVSCIPFTTLWLCWAFKKDNSPFQVYPDRT